MDFKKLFSRKKGRKSKPGPKRPEYQDPKHQPRLPVSRERALTLQSPISISTSLLQRLPLELRRPIYEAVLGHHTVHVAFEFGPREYRTPGKKKNHLEWRWWHCICTWDQTDHDLYRGVWWDQCRTGKIEGNPGPPNGMMGKLKLDFALLLTCRQIYSEAIDILYSTTTFNFASRQLLRDFSTLVLPHRFACITSIEMVWEFVNLGLPVIPLEDKKLYYDMWTMLAGMPNLRRVRIAIAAHWCPDGAPADLQDVWLGPLAQLGKMELFELLVPESYAKKFKVDQTSNFTIGTFQDITLHVCTMTTMGGNT